MVGLLAVFATVVYTLVRPGGVNARSFDKVSHGISSRNCGASIVYKISGRGTWLITCCSLVIITCMHALPVAATRLLALLPPLILASFTASASDPDYLSYERPVRKSVLEVEGSFGAMAPAEDKIPAAERRITRIRNFLWQDASLQLKPRSYYFDRQRDDTADSQAWTLGGALAYRTGWLRERLKLGATLYSSQKLYGPDGKDGTLLLKPGQNGFTVPGESQLTARVTEQVMLRLYRQDINLPYVNRQDNRMVPNTFEAYLLFDNEDPRLNYLGGHLRQMKRRNETGFISMSEAAGATDTDKGVTTLGARYSFSDKTDIGAINYHGWDVMNIFYTEGNVVRALGEDLALRISAQYTDQRGVGDKRIGDFETRAIGGKLAISYRHAILSLAFSSIDNNSGIRSPWGGYPGYLSLVNKDFDRAGEDAWLVGVSYDFSRLGLAGLSAFANYASGDTPDSGSKASPDQKELDLTLDYRFSDTPDGLWIRARTAFVDQDGHAGEDSQDYRLIVNYSVPLK
jgi:hypothetical protein